MPEIQHSLYRFKIPRSGQMGAGENILLRFSGKSKKDMVYFF